jgi:Sec-independent protein translocase protein TatA
MIVIIGLVILVAAVIVGVGGVLGNGGSGHALDHGFSLFGYHVTGSTGTLFLYGIVVGAIALLGLSLLLTGARRTSRRGRAARQGLKQSRRETAAVSRDRDQMIDQRDAARANAATPDTATADTATPDTATADTASADTATPDTATADTASADTASADTATADTASAAGNGAPHSNNHVGSLGDRWSRWQLRGRRSASAPATAADSESPAEQSTPDVPADGAVPVE